MSASCSAQQHAQPVQDSGGHRVVQDLVEYEAADEPAASPAGHRASLAVPHNLPAQPTPLVGRNEDILGALDALVRDEVRLVTLTGPAGVGKTRLALGIADCVLDRFPDGVFLVELAEVEDPNLVIASIAEVLGVQSGGETLLSRLASALDGRSMLLVLDNFEHLLPAA